MTASRRTVAILGRVANWSLVAVAVVMAYGIFNYPRGPIRYVNGLYVDKYGGLHSKADYEGARVWERVFFTTWAVGLSIALVYAYANRRKRSSWKAYRLRGAAAMKQVRGRWRRRLGRIEAARKGAKKR